MRDNDLRLITLGRLALVPAGGPSEPVTPVTTQRRPLALLAVLALVGGPVPRDALAEMFWGDEDAERARHSLSNALSHLRRLAGTDAIVTSDGAVALAAPRVAASARVSVDAVEFAAACRTRDYTGAVALYGGPFLEGVHVPGSRFERWARQERARLERLFLGAAEAEYSRLARQGRHAERAAVAARWLDAVPPSRTAALAFINALAAPGSPEALRRSLAAYDALARRLEREYDSPPDPRVEARAAEIHAALERAAEPQLPATAAGAEGAVENVPPDAMMPRRSPAADAEHARKHEGEHEVTIPAMPERVDPPAAPGRERASGRHRIPVWPVLAGVAALVIAGYALYRSGITRLAASAVRARPVIAITDVENVSGDTSMAWLQDGLPQMIATDLSLGAAVEVVPPSRIRTVLLRRGLARPARLSDDQVADVARRLGATWVVRGALTRAGDLYRVDLTVRDIVAGQVLRLYTVAGRDPIGVADHIAALLLSTADASAPAPRFADLATSSAAAYAHYLRGMHARAAGELRHGSRELDTAIALDPGFVSALHERREIALENGEWPVAGRLDSALERWAYRASPWDRLRNDAYRALHAGQSARAEALARRLVARYPRDPRAYDFLAQVLALHGKWSAAGAVLERELSLDSLAIEAGRGPCVPCGAYSGLMWARTAAGDFAGAEQAARRWVQLQPGLPRAWATLATALEYGGYPGRAVSAARRAASLTRDPEAGLTLGRALLAERSYGTVDSIVAAWRSSGDTTLIGPAADLAAMLARERGQFRRSNLELRPLLRGARPNDGMHLVHADNLARTGAITAARRELEAAAHSTGPWAVVSRTGDVARNASWPHALEADILGRGGANIPVVLALADTLEHVGPRSYYGRDWRLYHHARGLAAAHRGRWDAAEREFQAARWGAVGWTRTLAELAETQLAQHRPRDAIATLRLARSAPLDAMGRYLPHSEVDWRLALAFNAAGMRDSARVYAGRVRVAWRDADAKVRTLLDSLPR